MLVKVLFMFVLAGIGRGDGSLKLSMTVLYESKCPDSRSFVLWQLKPAMQLLRNRIKLQLVPFGKARSTNTGYGFECQHGPSECLGNVVQDCALSLMYDRDDSEKTEYVACEMSTLAGARGSLECVQNANLAGAAVNQCISSGRGRQLQLESERLTNMYSPRFIPTVVINGIFNQRVQDMSQVNLIDTLCRILQQPSECRSYKNSNYL
ncbi:gamma-interferon-inducible lysosomal thiol reductase [Amyelois transitella]|uniref:gamma-interferon-inducible lysosomal thiol reductase n=1 Tax=Amyelois transitella TaxID=680683 RepID=UPI00067B834A|nr:gamma-interferon-inducible lysosomal thiol reductase [Amyelois transitella]